MGMHYDPQVLNSSGKTEHCQVDTWECTMIQTHSEAFNNNK